MANCEITLRGAEELQKDLEKLQGSYATEVAAAVRGCANHFKNDVNKKYPADYKQGERPIPKAWKIEAAKSTYTGLTVEYNVRNTAPHFHLIENGHQGYVPVNGIAREKTKRKRAASKKSREANRAKMKYIGFVRGYHQCKITRDTWNSGKYEAEMSKKVDGILRKHNL